MVVVVVPVWALAEKVPAVSMAARMSSFFIGVIVCVVKERADS